MNVGNEGKPINETSGWKVVFATINCSVVSFTSTCYPEWSIFQLGEKLFPVSCEKVKFRKHLQLFSGEREWVLYNFDAFYQFHDGKKSKLNLPT